MRTDSKLEGEVRELTGIVWATLHARLPFGKRSPWLLDDLTGACAIGAGMLRQLLHHRRIKSSLVLGSYYGDCDIDHVFVRVGDFWADPTYEQFDRGTPWLVSREYPLIEEGMTLVMGKLPDDWPKDQHPNTYMHLLDV